MLVLILSKFFFPPKAFATLRLLLPPKRCCVHRGFESIEDIFFKQLSLLVHFLSKCPTWFRFVAPPPFCPAVNPACIRNLPARNFTRRQPSSIAYIHARLQVILKPNTGFHKFFVRSPQRRDVVLQATCLNGPNYVPTSAKTRQPQLGSSGDANRTRAFPKIIYPAKFEIRGVLPLI
jgi:hypothetical protein